MSKMRMLAPLLAGGAMIAAMALLPATAVAEKAVPIPVAAHDVPAAGGLQTAVLAGGCFWGMEAVFEHVKGVHAIEAGYAGGTRDTASYDQVSTETTRHAEAVKIVFDPHVVSYGTLLRIYFSVAHDPTTLNAQFPDEGTSYRSAVFAQTPAQAAVAKAYIAQLNGAHAFGKPVVTHVETGSFFPAESYHQRFFDRNPTYPYIVRFDKPKVAAFRAAYPGLYS
jgi:peptide-methionine (S)-S-oxide reductase